MKKIILILTILFQSTCFAYIYAETGDKDLDDLSHRLQQQDIEDRLEAIESRLRDQEQRQWEKDMFDSINNY
ncbi:TPA: carbohydrate porin [Legionella pneumophila]|nr:carbohydrate porin [Legionella pneumophila]